MLGTLQGTGESVVNKAMSFLHGVYILDNASKHIHMWTSFVKKLRQ